MKRAYRIRHALVVALLAASPLALVASAASVTVQSTPAALPAALVGTWQVTRALIDSRSPRTLQYQYDDPRLVGRLVTVSATNISTELAGSTCGGASATRQRTTGAALMRETMGRGAVAGQTPTARDYGLDFGQRATIDVLWVKCVSGDIGPVGPPANSPGNWMVILPRGDLAMRWFDAMVLVLRKVPPGAKPAPSFACTRAATDAERAICRSFSLASYDKSVAKAYARALAAARESKDAANVARLQADQRGWLQARDRCRADEACLRKAMDDRLEALSGSQ